MYNAKVQAARYNLQGAVTFILNMHCGNYFSLWYRPMIFIEWLPGPKVALLKIIQYSVGR